MIDSPDRLFLFKLARQKARTVDELIFSMSHEELLEWAEFYRYHPWPDDKICAYLANICATLANVNRDEKKRSQPFTASDFALVFRSVDQPAPVDHDDLDDEDFDAEISPMTVAFFSAKAKANSVH